MNDWQWEDEASAFAREAFDLEMELYKAEDIFADCEE
jgi:hypothetical protein